MKLPKSCKSVLRIMWLLVLVFGVIATAVLLIIDYGYIKITTCDSSKIARCQTCDRFNYHKKMTYLNSDYLPVKGWVCDICLPETTKGE